MEDNFLRYHIEKSQFHAAIDRAHDIVIQRSGSSAGQALTTLLANVWDTINPANAGEILATLDDATREIALDLIVGRALYGRPSDHQRHDKMEQLAYRSRQLG